MGDAMTDEMLRSFVLKLGGVSIVAAVIWMTAVAPEVKRLHEIKVAYASQSTEISEGERTMADQRGRIQASVDRMNDIRDELISQLRSGSDINAHKHIQDTAENNNLMVSRVEPLRSSESTRVNKTDQSKIRLLTKEFRVECAGSFDGLVGYINDLSNGSTIAKVNTFRIVPVSAESARMILQISTYQLLDANTVFSGSVIGSSTQVSDGSSTDGDL